MTSFRHQKKNVSVSDTLMGVQTLKQNPFFRDISSCCQASEFCYDLSMI